MAHDVVTEIQEDIWRYGGLVEDFSSVDLILKQVQDDQQCKSDAQREHIGWFA